MICLLYGQNLHCESILLLTFLLVGVFVYLPDALLVRLTWLVTVCDRTFPVVAAKLWNELPGDVTASQSLAAFRRQLKTFLFRLSYPVL